MLIRAKMVHVSTNLAPVVQRMDSTIHWINHYLLDNSIGFEITYPVDRVMSRNAIRRMPTSISVTKCPLAFLINFIITSAKKYGQ